MHRTAVLILTLAAAALAAAPLTTEITDPPAPSQPGRAIEHIDAVYDPQGNLIGGDFDAVHSDSLYWKDYYSTTYLKYSGKLTSPSPVNRTPMAFHGTQTCPCMTPNGEYVYEANGTSLYRFSTTDGSMTTYTLAQSGLSICGTDGNYIYRPSGTIVYKYTMTGTFVNQTTINVSTNQYSFSVANDTVWIGSGYTYYGFACSQFNGGSISYSATWATGLSGATMMNIGWDGTYYYIATGGYSSNTFRRFYANRSLYTAGTVYIDTRSVMCSGTRHDVGVSRIVAPAGLVDSGSSVTPACSVYNYGTFPEDFSVRLRVGTLDTVATVTGLAPATRAYVQFPSWTVDRRGYVTVSCSTVSVLDNNPANDRLLDSCYGRVVDVGAVTLVNPIPGDSLPLDTVLVPAGMWRNYGSTAADFEAWLLLETPVSGRVYAQKVDVTGLAAGDSVVVATFPACTLAAAGSWTAVCSTGLAGDVTPSNNQRVDDFFVFAPDVGVAAITWPVGSVPVNRDVYPGVKVKNYGSRAVVCGVRFVIEDGAGPVYDTSQAGIGLAIGDSATFNFTTPWRAGPLGPYTARAWTVTAFDADPTNDSARAMFQVGTGGGGNWVEVAQVPTTPSGKLVKDGGAMGWDGGLGRAVVLKGYKTGDFYDWDPVQQSWTTLEPMPLGVENKGPYKGANLCSDGNGTFYVTKGNNTSGFWKYTADDSLGTWTQLADVPLGLSNKKVKGGTDLAYVQDDTTGWVYLLKGYKTEFYRYNVNLGTWETLADAPAGVKNKYDKGSWLVHDPAGRKLYAHKAKYSELYAYSLDSMSWGPLLPGMPLANGQTGKNKKSKDGSDAVLLEGVVYGLKGGNTQDFYSFDLATMTWAEEDTIPAFGTTGKKKRVKAGGAITTDGTVLYALKGNKTAEVWRYTPTGLAPMAAGRRTAQAGLQGEVASRDAGYRLQVERNPSRGPVVLRWQSTVGALHSTLAVYDASGRCVHRAVLSGRTGSLQLRGLAAGVYLAKLTSADQTTSRKLVIQH